VSVKALAGEDFIAFERDIPTPRTIGRILKQHKLAPVLKLFNCENNDGPFLYKGGRRFAGALELRALFRAASQE
jgi:hypothetical protein